MILIFKLWSNYKDKNNACQEPRNYTPAENDYTT